MRLQIGFVWVFFASNFRGFDRMERMDRCSQAAEWNKEDPRSCKLRACLKIARGAAARDFGCGVHGGKADLWGIKAVEQLILAFRINLAAAGGNKTGRSRFGRFSAAGACKSSCLRIRLRLSTCC